MNERFKKLISKVIKKHHGISEGILIFIIPIIGYFLTYIYENAFFRTFDIPTSLIEINLISVFDTVSIILLISILIYLLSEFLYPYKENIKRILFPKNPVVRKISEFMYLNLLFIFSYFLMLDVDEMLKIKVQDIWLPEISLQVFIIFILIILPVISQKKITGFKNKLANFDKKSSKAYKDTIIYKFYKTIGPSVSLILILFIILFIAYTKMGEISARYKKDFLIIHTQPELIVLRKYSYEFICSTFDRKKKEIQNEFYLMSIDQIAKERAKITTEKIGPINAYKRQD